MVAFLIYWVSMFVGIGWLVLSIGFSLYYLSKKENGNLWAFALFNVFVALFLAVILVVYKTWDFGILTYSSAMIGLIAVNLVLTVLQAILGRVKPQTA